MPDIGSLPAGEAEGLGLMCLQIERGNLRGAMKM